MRILFKTTYNQDINIFKHSGYVFWYGILLAGLLLAPVALGEFYIGEMAFILVYGIAGLGLMVLVGFTGLASLGHAGFMAIGAYANAYLLSRGWPFLVSLPIAGMIGATTGALIAVPLKRMTGIYFAIATLAFAIIVEEIIIHWESVTGGLGGLSVDTVDLFGYELWEPWQFYYVCLGVMILMTLVTLNLIRSPSGRAFVAIRDSEVSAESMGINLAKYKIMSFAISGGITAVAGALFAHKLMFLTPDAFKFLLSIQLLMMVVVGGLGTIHGAIFGAIFVGLLPQVIAIAKDYLPPRIGEFPGMEPGIFGLILVLFIIFEPKGIYGRWLKLKLYLEMFPLYRRATFKKQKTYLKTERLQ
ncbi:branched-chain amino acid ABC transporter permease [bacterium]|nr:branched-chain amino acid ABC transporter permease [bacterium]